MTGRADGHAAASFPHIAEKHAPWHIRETGSDNSQAQSEQIKGMFPTHSGNRPSMRKWGGGSLNGTLYTSITLTSHPQPSCVANWMFNTAVQHLCQKVSFKWESLLDSEQLCASLVLHHAVV